MESDHPNHCQLINFGAQHYSFSFLDDFHNLNLPSNSFLLKIAKPWHEIGFGQKINTMQRPIKMLKANPMTCRLQMNHLLHFLVMNPLGILIAIHWMALLCRLINFALLQMNLVCCIFDAWLYPFCTTLCPVDSPFCSQWLHRTLHSDILSHSSADPHVCCKMRPLWCNEQLWYHC